MKTKLAGIAAHLKNQIKPWAIKYWWGYDEKAVLASLGELGIAPGDTIIVHGGFRPECGYRGTVGGLIEAFLQAVGPDGTVAMLSMPYANMSSSEFIKSGRPYDVRRSISRVGIISETFRRRPDVLRSLHPTHPIAAQGKRAEDLVVDPWSELAPFGNNSSFGRLADMGAKLVLYDVGFEVATVVNHFEDRCRETLPVPLYEKEPMTAKVIDMDGTCHEVQTLVLTREIHKLRNCAKLEQALLEAGILKRRRLGRAQIAVAEIPAMAARAEELMRSEGGFHDGNPAIARAQADAP